ncbi:prepilin-type N-terminal cleavage/methylation domain-containing protein [Alteromonas lipotrueiana]|uniref:prepilin-type N-terminal cleavage/methylation domain-containing protein n=1 Tax=Alteromonas lipotrueiana TaxID=2803815 RepID=UPI001FECFD84|nr:prepilin-type N-terminal cleavage/methylation domain-containing protein [Alteromonas lipotrueiana]
MGNQTPHHQQGVGMIEILVTLFVLAIGLLGVASLQFVGSFQNRDAISRTQAEFVAEQVAESLRSAARPAIAGDGMVAHNDYFKNTTYNFNGLSCEGSDPYLCHCLERPASIPDCEGAQCSESQMARYEGWALSCAAVQTNPSTRISLGCQDSNSADTDACSAGSRIQITLTWPVAVSANRSYNLIARCNPLDSNTNECVFKDITL